MIQSNWRKMTIKNQSELENKAKKYYVKYLVYEAKTEDDVYTRCDMDEKMRDHCYLIDSYENDNDDMRWHYDVYHMDGTTIVSAIGPPGFPENDLDCKKTYYQLQLISNKELTDTVKKLYKSYPFLNKFKEEEESIL